MHEKAAFVFWVTLILYLITLATVTYVGVYLTYIAIPIIVLSGLIMKITKPKETPESDIELVVHELGQAARSGKEMVSSALDEFNSTLSLFNEKQEKTRFIREQIHKLKLTRIEPEIKLDHSKSEDKKIIYSTALKNIDEQISELELEKYEIESNANWLPPRPS